MDRPVRRQDLVGVGVRQGAATAGGGPRGLPPGASAGSRRPTGSSGSCAAARPATSAPPATRPSTRTAATRPGSSWPRSTPTSPTSSTSSTIHCPHFGERAGGLTAEAAAWTGLPAGIGRGCGQCGRSRHRSGRPGHPGAGQLVLIMGTSTCHVMNGETLAEVPGMCGVVHGGITAGMWGYEAGPERRRRHLRLVRRARRSRRVPRAGRRSGVSLHDLLTELAARAAGRGAWPGRPGLVERQPLAARRPRAERRCSSDMTLATRPPDIYRALLESTAFGTR